MATTSELYSALGTETVLMTNTNLSALANNGLFLSAAYNNTQGNTGAGDVLCRIRATITMAVAATANTGFSLWFLKSQDGGTTYEAGGTAYTPLRNEDLVIPAPVDTTQREMMFDVPMPAGFFKVLLKNNATGQALKTDVTSAGSQLSITPYTRQSV